MPSFEILWQCHLVFLSKMYLRLRLSGLKWIIFGFLWIPRMHGNWKGIEVASFFVFFFTFKSIYRLQTVWCKLLKRNELPNILQNTVVLKWLIIKIWVPIWIVRTYIKYVSGMAYADRKRLRDHESTHQSGNLPLPFDCDFCGYSTRRKDNLQAHIKRLHPDLVNKHFFLWKHNIQFLYFRFRHLTIFFRF